MFAKNRAEKNLNLLALFVSLLVLTFAYFTYNGVRSFTGFFGQDLAWQALGFWLLFVTLSVAFTIFSRLFLQDYMTEIHLHQFEVVFQVILFSLSVIPLIQRNHVSNYDALLVGAFWTIATFLYEMIRYVWIDELGFNKLLSDYNLMEGRILTLLPLTQMGVAPLISIFQ